MKRTEIQHTDLSKLIDQYREAARRHGDATEIGDYKSANKHAETVAMIFTELKSRGPQAKGLLLRCLEDPAPGVQLWAASHALEFAPIEAERILAKLSSTERLLGVSAEATLKQWRLGQLRFP